MTKRIVSIFMCLVMTAMMLPAITLFSEPEIAEAAPYVMPSHNGLKNNVTYTLGAGTDAEVPVYVDFRASLSSKSFTLKYIIIHNTGTYVSTANAKNVHTNTNKTSTSAAWHYTVDNKSIYQGVPDKTFAGHAGTSRTSTPSSSNAIGIEMCVNNFPATETFGGEQWSNGTAIMNWYENQFDQTMKNTAYLCAVLCERWGLNYKTAIKMHYDALQYNPSTNYGKDCPMQMRATYDPATNKFKSAGCYTTGRDGYFWQIFWSYVEQYSAGAKTADSPNSNRHTISFESNGGSAVADVKVKDGEKLTEPTAPTRYGFNFAGWYCNPELTDPYDFNTPVPYDFTLYAKWYEAYWGANNNLMPNEQQLQLNDFNGQGEIWPYWNTDSYSSVTMYNGVRNDENWSWPSAYMEYENSFDSINDTYIYVKKDGTAQFNVVITYLDKNGYSRDLHLSSVANLGGDFPSGELEEFYNIGSYIRNIGDAPESGNIKFTKVTYFVVGGLDTYVKLYDLKFTRKFDIVDSKESMMNSNITQVSGGGNYTYNNGTLTMNATSDNGYSVKMNLNKTINPQQMIYLLMDVSATAPFDVSFELTNGRGSATMNCKDEFFNVFEMDGEFTHLPAGDWNVNMNLHGYYEWNGGAVSSSNIKSVTITLTEKGSLTLRALQVSSGSHVTYIEDGENSSGSLTENSNVIIGDVNGDNEVSTMDARLIVSYIIGALDLSADQLAVSDYNGDGGISTMDVREIIASVLMA
ncbi:MAG: N-acetylmuramoyl-L-alanine amidase [Clostridia bacterium]|nr:N-acetylmuramoyl-L-alanine amidase [Clostridia bacterium]